MWKTACIFWKNAWLGGDPERRPGGELHQPPVRKAKVILEDRNIDDARVLTEAAIFGDKTAVDEETVRLRSHIAQYRSFWS